MGLRAQTSDVHGTGGHEWMLFSLCSMELELSLFTVTGVCEPLCEAGTSIQKGMFLL